ncbi:NAD(P)/FAD-dependent oxidoreductase [Streptomyces sp. DR7-3]|uniref:NAD(P)/FAD-dependent oxidoreductase n=1 Tax=Streptomyces malaysiensis TaxID=92644 RepID=UPI0020438837|nr:FAD/NAD(P)-binding oxidoreductase [Streptomyces sp. DR7-3]MCM3811407.1 NAD(P)/FAD-dependent oxidoreductase [Streptomyces sp. DR7-3]
MAHRTPRRITIVGASIAGLRAAESLRRRGYDGALTLVGEEAVTAYQRPALSKSYLTGDRQASDLVLPRQDLDADLRLSTRAVQLDTAARQVWLREDDGPPYPQPYDGLLIACGTRARRLPGCDVAGVHTLRTVADADALRADLRTGAPRVAIIGGGFIGQEVAATARGLGLDTTLIDPLLVPGARALGLRTGQVLAGLHTDHGTRLRMGCGVTGVEGDGRVTGVRLSDGGLVPADVVVVGIGVEPAGDWLTGSGVLLDNGVRCRGNLAAYGAPGIVAAGDIACWDHPRLGRPVRIEHWENALRQADTAAGTLLDGESAPAYDTTTMFWSNLYDSRVQVVGHPGPDDTLEIVEGDPKTRRFVGIYRNDTGGPTGVLLFNMAHRLADYRGTGLDEGLPSSLAS